ncbi:MAG TPA: hypothetical protein VGF31_08060, partial [Myxococcaceae bacterium]
MSISWLAVNVSAEAIPLQEPLPSGTDGAALIVEPLDTGEALWPASFFTRAGRGPIARMRALGVGSKPETWESRPVPAYLARHPSAGNILVDAGLHPSIARDPRDNLGRFSGRHYRVREGQDVIS